MLILVYVWENEWNDPWWRHEGIAQIAPEGIAQAAEVWDKGLILGISLISDEAVVLKNERIRNQFKYIQSIPLFSILHWAQPSVAIQSYPHSPPSSTLLPPTLFPPGNRYPNENLINKIHITRGEGNLDTGGTGDDIHICGDKKEEDHHPRELYGNRPRCRLTTKLPAKMWMETGQKKKQVGEIDWRRGFIIYWEVRHASSANYLDNRGNRRQNR